MLKSIWCLDNSFSYHTFAEENKKNYTMKKENQIKDKALLKKFLSAVRTEKLLIIIDSASKGYNAVFSIVSYDAKRKEYQDYHPLLRELGFKNYHGERSLFKTECAGKFRVYIMDDIGTELRIKGVRLPKWWHVKFDRQQAI